MGQGIDNNNPKPLYEQIADNIKDKIVRGELKPGEQVASQNELVKEYGVSLITVKKALSNLVSDGTLFTRQGKGTFVSASESKKVDLSARKTIGVVLRDLKHSFFSMVVHGIEERTTELGYNLLLSTSSNNLEKEEAQIDHFRKLDVDGLIIASLSLQYQATDYIQKLHRQNFPYVMVSYMHDPQYWYVGSDQEYGGYIATEHLIKLGYRKIGYLHAEKGNLLSEVRKNGFYRALTDYAVPYNGGFIYHLETNKEKKIIDRFDQGYKFGKVFSSLKNKPEALFIYSDIVALGFEKALLEKGIRIPDDIAIVSFDDILQAAYSPVPLTTVHQPAEKIGRMAVDVIQRRILNQDVGNRSILKPSLIIRESCGSQKKIRNNGLQAG
ncbi:MAG: GntR family transcriptional regulator [Acidobacteriota bacterium]